MAELAPLTLPTDEAWILWVEPEDIDEDVGLARCYQWLDGGEVEQAERFVFPRDRHTYIVSHALLRAALSHWVPAGQPGSDPGDWTFVRGEFGRPEVETPARYGPEGEEPLRFNLSHTRGLAACIVTRGRDCGVDVEARKPDLDVLPLAQRVFSPAERTALVRLPRSSWSRRFHQLWTLKESYIKATGMGLQLPLRQITFKVPEPESPMEGLDGGLAGVDPDTVSHRPAPSVSFGRGIEDRSAPWRFGVSSQGPWRAPCTMAFGLREEGEVPARVHVRRWAPT